MLENRRQGCEVRVRSEDLKKLLEGGESETVEFKASFDKEILETSAAFANTKGGVILIGVSDRGDIKGVQIGKETLKDWETRFLRVLNLASFLKLNLVRQTERISPLSGSKNFLLNLFL